MDATEFDEKLIAIDRLLMEKQVPISSRLILAYFHLTGARQLRLSEKDSRLGPYEGPNLCHSVWDWYARHYPTQATIGREWGRRLILVREQAFRVAIPVHFDPSAPLDAFPHIEDLTEDLRRLLDEEEVSSIQTTFNGYFWQSSHLALVWTEWCAPSRFGLASDMIHRGWQDLKDSCHTFNHRDPFAVLFTAQQGPEKFLKAMLLTHEPGMTEDDLRKRYGHKIPKLLEACEQLEPTFSQFASYVHVLDYGPDIRYRNQAKSAREVIGIINLAYNICDAVGIHLIRQRRRTVGRASAVPKRFILPQDAHKVPPDILANLFFENLDGAAEEFARARNAGKADFVVVIDATGTGLEDLKKARWKASTELAANPPVRLYATDRQKFCDWLRQFCRDIDRDLGNEPEPTKPFLLLVMADHGFRVERLAAPRSLNTGQ
jgi:HEPN domain-containing protein